MTTLYVKAAEGTEFFPCNAVVMFGPLGHPMKCVKPCGHTDPHVSHLINYPVELEGGVPGKASITADIEWKINKHESSDKDSTV